MSKLPMVDLPLSQEMICSIEWVVHEQFYRHVNTKLNSYLSNDRTVPQACNQFEAAHICRTEWHRMADLAVERNHNPTIKRNQRIDKVTGISVRRYDIYISNQQSSFFKVKLMVHQLNRILFTKRSEYTYNIEPFKSLFSNNEANSIRCRLELTSLHSLFDHLNAMRPNLNAVQHYLVSKV